MPPWKVRVLWADLDALGHHLIGIEPPVGRNRLAHRNARLLLGSNCQSAAGHVAFFNQYLVVGDIEVLMQKRHAEAV